jgi:anaerobic ribonucleoside-triphosphate reductase activating protein
MLLRLAGAIQPDSILDGEGIRTVIWFQGCLHKCPGCHNPETHDLNGGQLFDIEDIKKEISELKYQSGITLSGGDPFYQSASATELAKFAHAHGLNVWTYTGFTFEELLELNDKDKLELLKNTDVLVDGRFEISLKSFECKFRGSKNQRIIDVPKSLDKKEVVLYYED